MPTEPRYELVLSRPRSTPPPVAVEQGLLVPRAVVAAGLSPLLSYWVPSRVVPWLAERGVVGDVFWLSVVAAAMVFLGAWGAVVGAMRVRRISELGPPVSRIEEMLVALLGLLLPAAPLWFGISSAEVVTQSLAIQAVVVFLAVLGLGGVLGNARATGPLRVAGVEIARDPAVRAMVAALLPLAVLSVLLPAVVIGAVVDGSPDNLGLPVLLIWVGVTAAGVAIGFRAWRDGRPAVLSAPRQALLTLGAMAVAGVVWNVAGGIDAPQAAYLVQPAAILVGAWLLARSPEAEPAAAAPARAPRTGAEPLLVPPAGAIFIGRTETPHHNEATGASETRIEARWMFTRPFAMVTAEYRDRHGLQVRKDTPTELVLVRPGDSPAAVRVAAQPVPPAGPDLPPPAPRTEVRVRVAIPD